MRHLKKRDKLGIKYSHKKSLISNLSNSLIKYEYLKITFVRAKVLKSFLEPIITVSKYFFNYNVRFVFKKLRNTESVLKLFKIIGPRYFFRNGGYLQIFKKGFRRGDNACLALIKLI
ncbi:50S ribosomal protein L17p [Candidatus Nasuia deltocephalinicola]|nr:50S ribosomal protein L17p [Candidatus Nasuia deltocephalinicola]